MKSFIKSLIPKQLIPGELTWKYVFSCIFYLDVTILQFFTETRMGYWFYCCTLLSAQLQPNAVSAIVVLSVIGASVSLATIKSSQGIANFYRLDKKAINDMIKDSPIWIIINAVKPIFLLTLLEMLIYYTESHRADQINRLLFFDYIAKWESSEEKETAEKVVKDIVYMVTTPSGLKGGLVLLKSHLLKLPYLFPFLISILLVILALLWLKEKQQNINK